MLKDLLKDNTLKNFDPVRDAFSVYDPADKGVVDMAVGGWMENDERGPFVEEGTEK